MRACYIFLRKRLWQNYIFRKLQREDFTIISDDCWGAEIYRKLGLQYQTPCVGLMIKAPCYINFVERFEEKIAEPLHFIKQSKYPEVGHVSYPIGALGDDVEIHFYHYTSEAEAIRKWKRRVARVNRDHLIFKIDAQKTRNEFPEEAEMLLSRFKSFSATRRLIIDQCHCDNEENLLAVKYWGMDGRLMFKKSLRFFDLAHWLNTGTLKNSLKNIFVYYLLIAPRVKKG